MGAAKDRTRLPRPSGSHLQHVPVVFVPGLKCSHLKEASTGKTVWFTPRMLLLNKKFANLHLPLDYDENGRQLSDGVVPHKVVRHVKFGPRTYPIYEPCLKELEDQGRAVYSYPYDWRRDLLETTETLLNFVEEVSRQHHGSKVQMVTHSMGGIITLAAINMRPELFHSCVFGGPPFRPCAPMFIDYINNGRPAGRNKKLLTSRTHFSWSSAFGVFPLHGHGIVDSDGKSLLFDFFDVNTWVQEQWGILHPDHPETVIGDPEYENDHLQRALARGKEFQEWIHRKHDISYPPMAVIAGTGHATKVRLMKDGPAAKCGIDADGHPVSYHGDDLIQVADTHLPADIPHYHYTTTRAHAFVLNDIDKLRHALLQVDPLTQIPEPAHFYPKPSVAADNQSGHTGKCEEQPHPQRRHHPGHNKRQGHRSANHPHYHHHHHQHGHHKQHITAFRAPPHVLHGARASSECGGARPSAPDSVADDDAIHAPKAFSPSEEVSPRGSDQLLPGVDTSSLSELDTTTSPTSPDSKKSGAESLPKMLKKRLSMLSLGNVSLGRRQSSDSP